MSVRFLRDGEMLSGFVRFEEVCFKIIFQEIEHNEQADDTQE